MDSNNNDTEVPEDQPEEQALQLNVKDFAYRSKAKAKPQRRVPAKYSPSIITRKKGIGLILNQGIILSAYEVSKKVIHLQRHFQQVQREDDGAVQFWKIKNIFRFNLHKFLIGLTIDGKHGLTAGGGAKKEISVLH